MRQRGEKWGIVSVFSAGNDGRNSNHYERPCSFLEDNPYGIVVANSMADETLPVGSEYGIATVRMCLSPTRSAPRRTACTHRPPAPTVEGSLS